MENLLNYLKKIRKRTVISLILGVLSCIISLNSIFPIFLINKYDEGALVINMIRETREGIMEDRLINHVDTIVHPEYRSYIHFEDTLLMYCNQTESLLSTPEISYENFESAKLFIMSLLDSDTEIGHLSLGLLEYLNNSRQDPKYILYDSFPLDRCIYFFNVSKEYDKKSESVAKKYITIINNNTIDDDEKIRKIGEEYYQLYHSKTYYNYIKTGIDLFSSINSQHREYLIQANRGI